MPSSIVCLDASFVLRLLLSASPEAAAVKMWCQGQEQGKTFAAPGLLYYEVVNALYRYTVRQQLTAAEASQLLDLALALNLELDHEPELHGRALRLAAELVLPAAENQPEPATPAAVPAGKFLACCFYIVNISSRILDNLLIAVIFTS
jgi:predicted nucleic acid-binding protein